MKMKSIKIMVLFFTVLLSLTSCEAKIANAKIETVKVYGNCEMCKKRIEKAGYQKGISTVNWNADTKMATVT